MCLVWDTGPVGHSLGPSPGQLPVCGHQVSPQLPTDHPQEQGGPACGSRVKRPHVCQHCGFKATYEEVVDTHLPECKYVPLQCPNMCGVSCESCEREVMEDHT